MKNIDMSKPVMVYRNLREGKRQGKPVYSVMQDGRVVSHTNAIMLRDVKFIVHEAGRQRVLREKRKNVHAFVRGFVVDLAFGTDANGVLPVRAFYNPCEGPHFWAAGAKAIYGAEVAVVNSNGISIAYGHYGKVVNAPAQ